MSEQKPKITEPKDAYEILGKRWVNEFYHDALVTKPIIDMLQEAKLEETDYSSLTVNEIMDKIKEFVNSDPDEDKYIPFVQYLAKFPVSLCKRDVSVTLKLIIGYHYILGSPDEKWINEGAEKFTYDDLSQLFGRSKQTIHTYIHQVEQELKELERKEDIERSVAKEIARREIIEEEKAKLREEQKNNEINDPG
jgi:predicted DNA-binding protein YlxM (UPF0122 family)